MNCQTFEPTVNDLARGRMMEATLRESALAHAEDCARCASRLAGERALNSSLRAFASSVDTMYAPATVEAALRTAFRQHRTIAESAPAVAGAPVRARRWIQWATAAAAAIVTVFAIQAFRFRESPAPFRTANNVALSNLPKMIREIPSGKTPLTVPVLTPTEGLTPHVANGRPGNQMTTVNYVANRNKSSRASREATTGQASQADSEIVTDFMPLTYGAAMSPNEGGQLVRVELPRSALVSMGLPMNAELSNERVKADVLLGHDGLARAIRFVR